jgi:hypothetical protein
MNGYGVPIGGAELSNGLLQYFVLVTRENIAILPLETGARAGHGQLGITTVADCAVLIERVRLSIIVE